jgi:hypothetical protein
MKRENYQKAGEKEEANIPQHSNPHPQGMHNSNIQNTASNNK